MKVRKYAVPALVLWLLAIGTFLRLGGLWDYAFSPDEVRHVVVPTGDNLNQIWEQFKFQTNGPLMFGVIRLLMKISYSELVLRCMSLIPGALLIMVFYFLGRTVSGPISGLAMAYMAAFSGGAIIVSQVIRPYSLLLFFLTGALWFFLLYFGTREKKYLYGYSVCMVLSISAHYPAVMPLAAIAIVWLAHSIIEKKPAREFVRIVLFNLPAFIIFGLLYLCHISLLTGGEGDYTLKVLTTNKYYGALFPQTFAGYIRKTYALFCFLSFPPYGKWLAVLAGAGFVLLWRSSRRSLAAIVFSTFLINFAVTYFKKYSFGGSRQSVYLFPLVAVMAGAAVQSGFNFLTNEVIPFLAKKYSLRIEYLKTQLLFIGVLIVLVSSVIITFNYKQSDFPRRSGGPHDFRLKRDNYTKVFSYLAEHMRPNDIIITYFKTFYYFPYQQLPATSDITSPSWFIRKSAWQGFNCFYIYSRYDFDETLFAAFQGIYQHVDIKKVSKVWVVNIGWTEAGRDEIETLLSKNPQYRYFLTREFSMEGGCIYSLKVEDIHKLPNAR